MNKSIEEPEPSAVYAYSVSVFDRIGNKLTNKELRHELKKKKENSTKNVYIEGSVSKGSKGPWKKKQLCQDRRHAPTLVRK